MTLDDKETIHRVEEGLALLTRHCETLISALETESHALADMNVDALDALAEQKEATLDALTSVEADLRATLAPIAARLGLPLEEVLSRGALGEDLQQRRAALSTLRDRIAHKNEAVRVRASHGLAFCRSILGTTPSYGPGGRGTMEPVDIRHFHQVL